MLVCGRTRVFMLPCVCLVFCFVCRLRQCDRTTFVKLYCQLGGGGQGWEPRNIFLIVCVYMAGCPARRHTPWHTRQPHLCHTSVTHLVSRVTSCHGYVTLSSHSSIKTLVLSTIHRTRRPLQINRY